ncbi:hypothetical protein C7T35_23085 [Variovorax sp. WS11]|uniref:hypothetical protein n=1 Tax=Variovorax sp. WS11 TaxID=1105204 RepID=UPI000D0DB3D8|nr:hypothetical protein [Variovorax sp. WS11]NDZ17563.1 hypothetical protein [Variovorax sp. WS11]PSL82232.1 hypothetical protein C7T35_23085 [Variovorax sp. WS11]
MQFLVHTGRSNDAGADVIANGLAAEVARVRALYASGGMRQIWHRGDRPGAVLLLECDDIDAASSLLETLPLVVAGAVIVESIVELKPYAGFAS